MPVKFDLGEYLNDVFVETGVGSGRNIIKAMRAGFPEIHGIENSQEFYTQSHASITTELSHLNRQPKITLYHGAHAAGLYQLCEKLQHKRVTFLLNPQSVSAGEASPPVHDEITAIRRWFQDTLLLPVIMVGGLVDRAPQMATIINGLLDIDSDYQFRIAHADQPRNVLIALPPTWVAAR